VSAIVIRRRPEDHGLEPDGGWTSKRATSVLDQKRAAVDRLEWTRAQTLRTPTLWMLILVFGLASLGIGALLLHLVAYLRDVGYSTAEAACAFSMIGLSGLLSKPIWGLIVERVPTRFVAAAEFLLLGIGIGLVMMSPSLWMTAASIFVFGVGVGGTLTVQETVWADYYGRRTLGVVRSIGRPFTVVFSAGGPVAAGLAYDLGGSYEVAFVLFIAAYLLAAVLVLFTPEPRHPSEGETRRAATSAVEGLTEAPQV
jgi:cyanate permease